MTTRYPIPIYSKLSPRQRQYVHMFAGILAMGAVALIVSGMIGGPTIKSIAPTELPRPKPLSGVPGAQLDAKDEWMGGAGKDLARLKDDVRLKADELVALRGELKQTRDQFTAEMNALRERGVLPAAPAVVTAALPASAGMAASAADARLPPTQIPGATAIRPPATFPPLRTDRQPPLQPAAGVYPPGQPNYGMAGGQSTQMLPAEPAAPALMRVSVGSASTSDGVPDKPGEAPSSTNRGAVARHVSSFLPVGFTRAVLLGGLLAPTGGQAQSNPVPVLLRLADLSVLPNGYRGQVKDCLVIGEGYGELSAERAYIRAALLSCVLRDGQVLEVPIKGSVFGADGMNGMAGKLITKQGAILGNALLAGIASGIGSGISQASQTVTTSSLGQLNSNPTDTTGILRQGFGTGVGRALDRLAQYYISLAERTSPVIEVQPGQFVDLVLQQGVAFDVALASIGPDPAGSPTRGSAPDNDRSSLMRVVTDLRGMRGTTDGNDE